MIKTKTSESYHPHQNPAESEWGRLNCMMKNVLRQSQAPIDVVKQETAFVALGPIPQELTNLILGRPRAPPLCGCVRGPGDGLLWHAVRAPCHARPESRASRQRGEQRHAECEDSCRAHECADARPDDQGTLLVARLGCRQSQTPFTLGLPTPHTSDVHLLGEGFSSHRIVPSSIPPEVLRQRPSLRTRHDSLLLKAVIAAVSRLTCVHVCKL